MGNEAVSPLSVLFLPPTAWGPYERSFLPGRGPDPRALYRHLAAVGIEAKTIDPNRIPWNPFAGRGSLLESLDLSRALRILVRERQADLIVSIFEGAAAPLLALRPVLGGARKIALWDLGLTEDWPLRERILDFVVPRVDGIMVLSAHQKPYIERRWRVRTPVDVISHSVDTEFFRPGSAIPNAPILSIGEDVGRDFYGLLRAIKGVDADVVIKTRSQRDRIDLSQHSRVSIVSEWLSHLDLRALYEQSRFVVVPLTETLNASGVSSILEAGAMGKAVIVNDNSAIRDFIAPGETCLAVPCRDPEALRTAIDKLMAEPETCATLGANARRFVEERFSIESFARGFAGALRRIKDRPAVRSEIRN